MKKVMLVVLGLLLGASGVLSAEDRLLVDAYDLDSATYIYCTVSGVQAAQGTLNDVAASTTVTGSGSPFLSMGVGDILYFGYGGAVYTRKIVTYTNANSVVVDSALTVTGALTTLTWRNFVCGANADDGWFGVSDLSAGIVQIDLTAITATSIDVTVEGRVPGGSNATLVTSNFTVAEKRAVVITEIGKGLADIRVGLKVNTDGAGAENLSVRFGGR